jgi:hypothetical protein
MTVELRSQKEKWGRTKKKLLTLCGHRLNQAPSLFTKSNQVHRFFRTKADKKHKQAARDNSQIKPT